MLGTRDHRALSVQALREYITHGLERGVPPTRHGSLGNGVAASVLEGISASHIGRSLIVASTARRPIGIAIKSRPTRKNRRTTAQA